MRTYSEKLKTIFFPVEKVPSASIMQNPDMEFNSDNAYAIVATWPAELKPASNVPLPKQRQKTLNFCSDVYQLILNQDVLEPLIPVLEQKFKSLEIIVSNDKDAQFGVRVSPAPESLQKMTEVIVPLVTFTNSYDGKLLAQATGGMVRYLVDDKGNVFQTFSTYLKGLSFVYKFKHNNEGIYTMLELSEKIDQYLAEFHKVTDLIEGMKQITVKTAGLEKFLRKMADGTIFPLKELEETIERIHYESMLLDVEPNLWTVYNAMNYITENTEAALTQKHRMDVNAKVFINMVEHMDSVLKKKKKEVAI
jgi:hypothetical protein